MFKAEAFKDNSSVLIRPHLLVSTVLSPKVQYLQEKVTSKPVSVARTSLLVLANKSIDLSAMRTCFQVFILHTFVGDQLSEMSVRQHKVMQPDHVCVAVSLLQFRLCDFVCGILFFLRVVMNDQNRFIFVKLKYRYCKDK